MFDFSIKSKTIDSVWEATAAPRIYSYEMDRELEFFSSMSQLSMQHREVETDKIKSYGIFAPDAMIKKISGILPSARKAKTKTLIAYVDGAYSTKDGVGAGAYGVFFSAGDYTSEYSNVIYDNKGYYSALGSELSASVVAIKEALRQGYKEVIIHYDFQGIQTFNGWHIDQKQNVGKVFDTIVFQYSKFLECVHPKIKVKFVKVKAHDCDMGNEHANYLAAISAKQARLKTEKLIGITARNIKAKEQAKAKAKINRERFNFPEARKIITPFLKDKRLVSKEADRTIMEYVLRDGSYSDLCATLGSSIASVKTRKKNMYYKLTQEKIDRVPQNHELLKAMLVAVTRIKEEDALITEVLEKEQKDA